MNRFTLPDSLDLGGAASRYRLNVEALRVLKTLREESRPATPDEARSLARYSGWGDSAVLKHARKVEKYGSYEQVTGNPSDEVAALVTAEEWSGILGSSLNAHYTSLDVVRAVWRGIEALGLSSLDRVRLLEPSCGVGHFLGAAPSWVRERAERPVLIELDPLTAEIASRLYPEAEVVRSGFEDVFREPRGERTLRDYFDVAISNVPFGKVKVADPGMHPRAATENLHNYFIARMLELVRPGGIVAVITSRYTLDGTTSAPVCRRAWAEKSCLELAVRLPCDTFAGNAGTQVVTDVLFLRRLREGEVGNGEEWVGVEERDVSGSEKRWRWALPDGTVTSAGAAGAEYAYGDAHVTVPVPVSAWYARHPDCLLGREALSGKMHGYSSEPSLDVADEKAPEPYRKGRRRDWDAEVRKREIGRYNLEPDPAYPALDAFRACQDRHLRPAPTLPVEDSPERGDVLPSVAEYEPETDLQRRWWATYKAAKEVLRVQVARCTDEELADAQRHLSRCYADAGGSVSSAAVARAFKERPDILSFLLALERPDGTREAIFSQRTVFPEPPAVESRDPLDALYRCLDVLGHLDIGWVGKACGLDRLDVIERLGDRIYKDPDLDRWVLAEEYLSGNVRRKLKAARAWARRDEYWDRNVSALEAVQPADLGAEDVQVQLKSPWVPGEVVSQFAYHLLGAQWSERSSVLARQVAGAWVLDWDREWDNREEARSWSTTRAGLGWLLQCGLDGRAPLVYDEDADGKRRVNQEQTVLAQAKLDAVQDEYRRWLWEDDSRARELLEIYNDRFNCHVQRRWDGSFLTFPGMASSVELRPFQRDGVARVLFADRENHPALIWPTGAGKTFGGIAAVEKLLQLGLARKVLICVPKHLVPQWADDYRRLFPGRADQVLTAGKDDLSKKERGTFLSRAATGGYRVVILSHTQFKAIPVRDETFKRIIEEQLEELEREIKDQESLDDRGTSTPLKRLQLMKKNLEARLKDRAQRTAKDSSWTVTFEELGFDVLLGDEAQAWKNLQLVTRMGSVAGIRTGSSQISLDFLVKVRHLQRERGRIVLATATPIANSLAEAYVFASYLQPDALRAQGIETADAFFGAFTRTYSSVELEPSCAGYRVVSRLEFGNIPELVRLLRQSWHVVRPEDLGLDLPELATGQEIVSSTPGSEALREYVADIAERVGRIRGGMVEPSTDNMLKVCSDGRWASLVNGPPDGEIRDTKLDRVAENVLLHWRETEAERGAQIVFCDLGTPTGEAAKEPEEDEAQEVLSAGAEVEQSRVYEYIRHLLLRGGIPREQVEFLQDHQKDPARLRDLYRRVNSGEVRVLLGSAPTGMNVQERLAALHHVDPVWRPDWKTQRDGRILRQGNIYKIVSIYLYLTEGSFDAYMWGLVKAKLRVIEQVTHGDPTIRKLDGDVGDVVLRASEIQAIASGNPRVLEFVGVQNELTKLSALRNEYEREQDRMLRRIQRAPSEAARLRTLGERHRRAAAAWAATSGRAFSCVVGGATYDARKDAGAALLDLIGSAKKLDGAPLPVGNYRGFDLGLCAEGSRAWVLLSLPEEDPAEYQAVLNTSTGVWTSADLVLANAGMRAESYDRAARDAERDAEACMRGYGVPWDRARDYGRTYARYKALAEELSGLGVSAGEFRPPAEGWVPEEEVKAPTRGKWVQCAFSFMAA